MPTKNVQIHAAPLSLSFDKSRLSDGVYRDMWEKACQNNLVSNVPGTDNCKMVASMTHPDKPHLVSMLKSGKMVCDCLNVVLVRLFIIVPYTKSLHYYY